MTRHVIEAQPPRDPPGRTPFFVRWARVTVSRQSVLAFGTILLLLLVLGGSTIPVVGGNGDARILWYGGSALGALSAQVVTPRGLLWTPWLRRKAWWELTVWTVVVLVVTTAGYATVIAVHGAPWLNSVGVFLTCWGSAVVLWRRGLDLLAPLVPFVLVIAVQIGAAVFPLLDAVFDARGSVPIIVLGLCVAFLSTLVPPRTT